MSSLVRKILYDAMEEAARGRDSKDWTDIIDASYFRLKEAVQELEAEVEPGDRGEAPKYILEYNHPSDPTNFRILKLKAVVDGDFPEYRCVLETRSAVVASTLMHALTDGELEL